MIAEAQKFILQLYSLISILSTIFSSQTQLTVSTQNGQRSYGTDPITVSVSVPIQIYNLINFMQRCKKIQIHNKLQLKIFTGDSHGETGSGQLSFHNQGALGEHDSLS